MNSAYHLIERERQRLVSDLHDGPIQMLSSALLQADILEDVLTSKEARCELESLKRILGQCLHELRHMLPESRRLVKACGRLTPREKEIWKLLSSGASNAEISKQLFVSESTVKFHIRNIFHKLGVKNRVEAARIAYDFTVA